MTDEIPPRPGAAHMPPPPLGGGGYPPPPPPSGGYLPPPPGPVLRGLAKESYTPWLTRVAAYVIDHLPVALIVGAGWLIAQNFVESICITGVTASTVEQSCSFGYPPKAVALISGATLLGLVFMVWNLGYRQGTTGSSIGKSLLKFTVVSEKTAKPIGFGPSVLREIAHLIDAAIFYVGFLFPLWDAKRQTLSDKIVGTVCLPLDGSAEHGSV